MEVLIRFPSFSHLPFLDVKKSPQRKPPGFPQAPAALPAASVEAEKDGGRPSSAGKQQIGAVMDKVSLKTRKSRSLTELFYAFFECAFWLEVFCYQIWILQRLHQCARYVFLKTLQRSLEILHFISWLKQFLVSIRLARFKDFQAK